MTITPFLTITLRSKKDAILARQRARRVAILLHFGVHEQTCIAAGTFVVACQALAFFRNPRLCFQIENHQLQVFAEQTDSRLRNGTAQGGARFSEAFAESEQPLLYRLAKPLPPQEDATEELDLGWLIQSIEETAHERLFDEIVKQNQEVLALLHDLRLYQGTIKENEEKSTNPHAA